MRINDNGVDRDMTPDEQTAYELAAEQANQDQIAKVKAQELIDAAKTSAIAKFEALGLTAAEIAALVSA